MAAQVQHGRLKGKAGAGRRLIEQGGELFVSRNVLVSGRVGADAVGQIQQEVISSWLKSKGSMRWRMNFTSVKVIFVEWKNRRNSCNNSVSA